MSDKPPFAPGKLLWLDLESTGLDPQEDVVLEVAAEVADPRDPYGTTGESFVTILRDPQHEAAVYERLHGKVKEMHEASGLWSAWKAVAPRRTEDVDAVLAEIAAPTDPDRPTILAGSSVHFDRGFIKTHFPRLDAVLHYRHLDVSCLRLACELAGMPPVPKIEPAHRALADVAASRALGQRCADWMRTNPADHGARTGIPEALRGLPRADNRVHHRPADGPVAVHVTYYKPSGTFYTDEWTAWEPDADHYTKWTPFERVARIRGMIAVAHETPLGFPQMHVPGAVFLSEACERMQRITRVKPDDRAPPGAFPQGWVERVMERLDVQKTRSDLVERMGQFADEVISDQRRLMEQASLPSLRVRRLTPDARLPAYATAGAAGLDLCAALEGGALSIPPGGRACVATGIAIQLPPGHEGQIRARSGLAAQGLTVINVPGTIDEDYRGEIQVLLVNHNQSRALTVAHGDRIAQLVVAPVVRVAVEEVDALEETPRGAGGLGSTGR